MSVWIVLVSGVAAVLSGCAAQLSEDRIRLNTSGILGVAPTDVTISNRRDDTMSTYYTATTTTGARYACVISGGNFVTAGLATPPVCNKGDAPPDATSVLTGRSSSSPPSKDPH